ncbi:hypothetical protein LSH36_154g07051 [Paralvinella palmiformis]|uniref:RNA-binding region-containing protein 3 n=1 Tax=Paralvinella palmiformis TaxID=53620 RepID=A0AAD9N9T5_9ANNE|nr:hypothetical protein LSH36_154g07051 [Paralvinella palmiformis]
MAADNTVLIVRHLPTELSTEDKEDLLKHFGAVRVRCFGNKGSMKHTGFAFFASHSDAVLAMERLHQMELLGTRLSVEFSNSQMRKYHPSIIGPTPNVDIKSSGVLQQKPPEEVTANSHKHKATEEINSISSRWGIEYPYNPRLRYLYPSPTVSILTNIANALASVPRFYVQVLHLMNKMNLPPPFGPITATPPIPEGAPPPLPPLPEGNSNDLLEESESELESDGETPKRVNLSYKRAVSERMKPRKRHKLQIQPPPIHTDKPSHQLVAKPEEVFEQPQAPPSKKIEFKLSTAIAESLQNISTNSSEMSGASQVVSNDTTTMSVSINQESVEGPKDLLSLLEQESGTTDQDIGKPESSLPHEEGAVSVGFGKMEPRVVTAKDSSESEEESWGVTDFISSRRLRKGRLSSSEARDLSVLKNYSRGEPTPRLYIKNLAKQTTEKDLHYVFGRYVNWDDELEKNMFDVRLMKEGRMKGQAFVTLPRERLAERALEETHTFVLHDKPMVVQFARSAKPKDTAVTK